MSDEDNSLPAEISEVEMLMTPLDSEEHLQLWLKKFIGLTLPDVKITKYANATPLSFVWEVYRAIMDGKSLHIMGLSGRDSGKCCLKGTLVLTNQGLKTIENVRIGDQVWDGFQWQYVKATFDEGVKTSYEVETEAGYRLAGSARHRVRIVTPQGLEWRHIKHLEPGDRIAISSPQLEISGTDKDRDLGMLAGLLTGDGGLSLMDKYNIIRFSTIDPAILDEWKRLMATYVCPELNIQFDGRCTYRIQSAKACGILREMGFLSCKSPDKRVPHIALNSLQSVLGYIEGLFATDGGIEKRFIYLYQSNRALLEQTQSCLAAIGIFGNIKIASVSQEFLSKYKQPYSLQVTGLGIKRLKDLGFRVLNTIGPKRDFNSLTLPKKPSQANPIPSELLADWMEQFHDKRGAGTILKKSRLSKYRGISKEKIIAQRDGTKKLATSTPDWISNLENLSITTVSKVSCSQGYFHDIEVENSHAYWSNGLISHNTVALSIMDLLSILHDERAGLHSAMTKAQATRARDYLTQYINKQKLLRDAVTKDNTTKLDLMVGGNEVGLELISLTPKAVQGAHYSFVSVDELASSMDPQQIKAYRDLSGIPGTSSKGKPAVIVKITSRQSGASLAEHEVKNAHKSGIQIRKWTTIDSMKRCEDWRSGDEKMPLWINITKGLRYTEEEFSKMDESEREGFEYQPDTLKGCYSCPLAVYCQGQAKKQTGTSVLLRSVDDVIAKVNAAGSHEWVLSQIMSLQPSNQGLVYPDFNQDLHIKDWDQMYEILTDERFPSKVTREIWHKEARKRGVTFYGGIDWGFTNPSTAVVFGVDQRDRIYVVEAVGMLGKNDSDWVEFVKANIHNKWNVQMWMPDSESKSGLDFLKKAELPRVEIDKGPGSVLKGINIVRSKLRVPGTNNQTVIFFNKDLPRQVNENHPGIIEEFSMYSKDQDAAGNIMDDKVIKANDHFLDALRYAIYWLYGKANAQAVFANLNESKNLNYTAPTGPQLAEMQGIKFEDNRDETKHLTDPNRKPGDDDDDPGDGGGGRGGLVVAWT